MIRNVCTQAYIMRCRNPGGLLSEFNTGRLPPKVQSLALLYTIFGRKGTGPFVYLPLKNGTSLTYQLTKNKSFK